MKKILASTLLLAGFLVTAWAADKTDDIESKGRPKDFKTGQQPRYAVWHDDKGWNIRMTASSAQNHRFTGTIQTIDGKFTAVLPVGVEFVPTPVNPNNKTKNKNKNPGKLTPADVGTLNPEQNQFRFSMNTSKGREDGIHFTVNPDTTAVRFHFEIDGKEQADDILIGSKGENPKKATFTLPAHAPKGK